MLDRQNAVMFYRTYAVEYLFAVCHQIQTVNEPSPLHPETRTSSARRLALKAFLACVVPGVALFLLLGYLMRDEQIASFTIGPHLAINVYAEGDFHYEPPGYIYFELRQWGEIRVPRRRFMGIGPERKPSQKFTLIRTPDDEVAALVLNGEVQMIHEFSSGYTWPGPYTNVTEPQWQIAELLLQRLRSEHPEVRCPRQDWYRRQLDRQHAK